MSGKLTIVPLADTSNFGVKADQNTNDEQQLVTEQQHTGGALEVL